MSRKRGSTDAVIAVRVDEVLSIRLAGGELYDLRAHAAEKGWNVSERQLRRYVEAADEVIAESLERDRERLFRRHVAQRRSLYARALQEGDYRTALAVVKDEAELQNLYPARKHEVAGPKGAPITLVVTEQVVSPQDSRIVEERFAYEHHAATGSDDQAAHGPGDLQPQ